MAWLTPGSRRRSPVAPGGPARTFASELTTLLLDQQGRHDEDEERRPEQPGGDDVPELQQPVAVPVQGVRGEVEPPGGDDPHRYDGQEPQHDGADHRLAPGPLELPEERVPA